MTLANNGEFSVIQIAPSNPLGLPTLSKNVLFVVWVLRSPVCQVCSRNHDASVLVYPCLSSYPRQLGASWLPQQPPDFPSYFDPGSCARVIYSYEGVAAVKCQHVYCSLSHLVTLSTLETFREIGMKLAGHVFFNIIKYSTNLSSFLAILLLTQTRDANYKMAMEFCLIRQNLFSYSVLLKNRENGKVEASFHGTYLLSNSEYSIIRCVCSHDKNTSILGSKFCVCEGLSC